jgi:hypothetical protein
MKARLHTCAATVPEDIDKDVAVGSSTSDIGSHNSDSVRGGVLLGDALLEMAAVSFWILQSFSQPLPTWEGVQAVSAVTEDGDLIDMPGWPETGVIMTEFDCFDDTHVSSAELENILQMQSTLFV